jgi:hypothetical protein
MPRKRIQPDRTELERNRAILRRAISEVWETTARDHPDQEVSVTFPVSSLVPGVLNFFAQDTRAIPYVKHVEKASTPVAAHGMNAGTAQVPPGVRSRGTPLPELRREVT